MASHFDNLANPRHPSDPGVIFATRYWAFLCQGGIVSTDRRDRERSWQSALLGALTRIELAMNLVRL